MSTYKPKWLNSRPPMESSYLDSYEANVSTRPTGAIPTVRPTQPGIYNKPLRPITAVCNVNEVTFTASGNSLLVWHRAHIVQRLDGEHNANITSLLSFGPTVVSVSSKDSRVVVWNVAKRDGSDVQLVTTFRLDDTNQNNNNNSDSENDSDSDDEDNGSTTTNMSRNLLYMRWFGCCCEPLR